MTPEEPARERFVYPPFDFEMVGVGEYMLSTSSNDVCLLLGGPGDGIFNCFISLLLLLLLCVSVYVYALELLLFWHCLVDWVCRSNLSFRSPIGCISRNSETVAGCSYGCCAAVLLVISAVATSFAYCLLTMAWPFMVVALFGVGELELGVGWVGIGSWNVGSIIE